MKLRIQSTIQNIEMFLSSFIPSWLAAKVMLPDYENPSKRIYIFTLPALLTYTL